MAGGNIGNDRNWKYWLSEVKALLDVKKQPNGNILQAHVIVY
jgi:hypothetical protein